MSPLPILAAFVFAAAGIAHGLRPFAAEPARRAAWSGAATVGLAWSAAFCALQGWSWPWPPREALHHLSLAVPLASLLWFAAGGGEERRARAFVPQAVAAVVFLALALEPYLEHHWEGAERIWRFGALGLGGIALLAAAAPMGARPGPALPAAWLAAFVGAALALAQSWVSGAFLAGALACVPGGALVACLWRVDRRGLAGAALPLTWVLGGLVLIGNHYSKLPWSAALLLVALPHLGWIGGGSRRGAWIPAIVGGGLAALAVRLSLVEVGPYGY